MKNILIGAQVITLILVGANFDALRAMSADLGKSQAQADVPESESVEASEQLAYKTIYYIGCNDGTCNIPRASGLPFNSHCVWNYQSGNAAVPNMFQTYSDHQIQWFDGSYKLSVTCVDEFGKLYYGTEGLRRP